MKKQAKIEYISHSSTVYTQQNTVGKGKKYIKLKIFFYTFLISLVIGLAINYSRPAVYLSNATLLTSAATAVDENSQEVDFQHVVIQKQKLLGAEILNNTLLKIKGLNGKYDFSEITISQIRAMLNVVHIADTNLINMQAQGSDPEMLPVIINAWIKAYLEAKSTTVKDSADNTVGRVKGKLDGVNLKISQARQALDLFRKKHSISSTAREENELPAAWLGLTKILNDANENFLKSKAKLDAVNLAIKSGQVVVPKQEQIGLAELEKEYRDLTARMAEFDKHFTRDYLQYQGSMKNIPEQIKALEQKVKLKRKQGKEIVRAAAKQQYFAAKLVLEEVKLQRDEHKKKSAEFTSLFSKHQQMVDDLTSLEVMARNIQGRLVAIQSTEFEKYPQVEVVERASVNLNAVSPDYKVGLYIALLASLALAFFAVWLIKFLMQDIVQEQQKDDEVPVAAWMGSIPQQREIPQQAQAKHIEQEPFNGLPYQTKYKKISDSDIEVLLEQADSNTQQVILLLLSGLNAEEISLLSLTQVNSEFLTIHFLGQPSRIIPIGARLAKLLIAAVQRGSVWHGNIDLSVGDIKAMLYCSAVDLGLDNLNEPLSEILSKSYIIYLVEQGIYLTELSKVIAILSPLELAAYAAFSPVGGGCHIDEIQVIYPACK